MKDVSGRKKVISLEPFDLEKFALHFHKCPDVVEAQKPDSETKSKYFGVIQAFTLAQLIVKDPIAGKEWRRIGEVQELLGDRFLVKVAYPRKGLSKYLLYLISLQIFLQISCS